MGNSTVQLQEIIDSISAMGDVSPQALPSGYDFNTTISIANDTINALIARKFNWKWNSANAAPFLTNTFQQDYPQIGITTIGWIENGRWFDINNTTLPLPNGRIEAKQDLEISNSRFGGPPFSICWMYNHQLNYGNWPGATMTYTPLLGTSPIVQNPPMAFVDANGNILTLTTFGVTGATQPVAAIAAAEGVTVADGTCIWTVCGPYSQGFRLNNIPPGAGPVYQVKVKFQMTAPKFTALQNFINPVPDDYANHFRTGYKAGCYGYSPDPKTRSEATGMMQSWIQSMVDAMDQGAREPEAFMLIPATQVVEPRWGMIRNPMDPARPY